MREDDILLGYRDGKYSASEASNLLDQLRKSNAKHALSEGQKGLWFLERGRLAASAYNVPLCISLPLSFDIEAFKQACEFTLKQHPILNSLIREENGLPYRQLRLSHALKLHHEDASDLPEVQFLQRLREHAKIPFKLDEGPLIRFSTFLRSDERYILIVVHHVVFDGASIAILLQTLFDAYAAYGRGDLPQTRKLSADYSDFVSWEKGFVESEQGQSALRYWQDNLRGIPAELKLSIEKHAVAAGADSQTQSIQLAAQTSRAIRDFCRASAINPAIFFLGLYQVLLQRYCNERDIVVGMATMVRPKSVFDDLIGYFVNMLPIRCHVSDDQPLTKHLKHVKQTVTAGLDHAAYPFPLLIRELALSRQGGAAPIFQVAFEYQSSNMFHGASRLGQSILGKLRPLGELRQEGEFKLVLEIIEDNDAFTVGLKHDRNYFDSEAITALMEHFITLIQSALDQPTAPIGTYCLLSAREQEKILIEWNATTRDYPQDKCLHELFEAQVHQSPNSVAVVFEDKQWTYAELNRRANQLAHYLRGRGVDAEQLVAICIDRSLEMIVGLLGILKAGAGYVPLDPSYPMERLDYMLKDAAPCILLTQEALKNRFRNASTAVISLQELESELSKQPDNDLQPRHVGPTNLAYVIYTSGSTGRPKGVMVTHGSVINFLTDMRRLTGIDAADRLLAVTTLSFDIAALEVYLPLVSGAELLLVSRETAADAARLINAIDASSATIMQATPATWKLLLSAAWPGCSNLKALCGGEALTSDLARQLQERVEVLWNMYGPTETTIWSCTAEVMDVSESQSIQSIGRPIANTHVYILDSYRQPVPIGVVGEIYIGGAGVARGYLNLPDLTAERFIADSFRAAPARMYKTGDLGRWRQDGNIEYLGRNDSQVKIRGFRIELGEVEAQLARHPSINDAVVVAREEAAGEKRLVAYFTARENALPNVEELRAYLQTDLPDYMMPSAFVALDQLPLTPNGKLDRKALPAPGWSAYGSRQYEAPQGEIEDILAGVWQTVLSVERVGRHDNFFELGGHSLLIIQMSERLRRAGLHVEVRNVFSNPTLMALAHAIQGQRHVEFTVPPNRVPANCAALSPELLSLVNLRQEEIDRIVQKVPGGTRNVQEIYPLAPLQEGILFHHLLNEQGDTYISPVLLAVESQGKLTALLAALQTVIDRHDILRTAILWQDLPRPLQVVYRRAVLPVEEIELDPRRDAVEQLKERMSPKRLRLDLQNAPLLRLYIARDQRSSQLYALLLQHHLVTDHVSLQSVLTELTECLNDRAAQLPQPVPYRNYVAQALARAEQRESEIFFRNKLGDIDEPTAPFGLLNVQGDGAEIVEVREYLDTGLARQIRSAARLWGVSSATLFHVAWSLVVAHTSGRDDVVFGTVLVGRTQGMGGSDQALGMFNNTLPLRIPLKEGSVQQVIQRTQRELIELLSHEQASPAEAQRSSGIRSGAPLFTAVLNYRHGAARSVGQNQLADPGLGLQMLAFQERTNYPITVSVDDLGVDFTITALTDRSIDPSRVSAYLRNAVAAVAAAAECEPHRAMLDLEILTQNELQARSAANSTAAARFDCRLQTEFVERALASSERIALEYSGGRMTYGELLDRSCSLAEQLVSLGAQRNQLIAVVMDRGWEQVVAVLGILMSGAAYLPIDPHWPAQRRAYLLEQGDARIAVTQSELNEKLEWGEGIERVCVSLKDSCRRVTSAPPSRQSADDLAYVIFTSGSTGVPKGVVIDHKGAVNTVLHMNRLFDVTEHDKVLAVSELNFDLSVYDIFGLLAAGGTVVLLEPTAARAPDQWLALIKQHGVTVWNSVPQLMNMLVDLVELDGSSTIAPLRLVLMSGDWIPVRLPDRIKLLSPTTSVISLGGATEGSIWSIYYPVESVDSAWESIPYGKALPNQHMYVLNKRLQPCPDRVAGDIYIGGTGVALGYWKNPEITNQQFLQHPTSGERLYKTGDLGRVGADGNIEFLGRNDQQVKVRGFRIELAEIEAHLSRFAQVKEGIVIVREDLAGDKRLVAYFTQMDGATVDIEAMRVHLKSNLPEYMVPSAFVLLDKLPLTPNGKLDRRALPAPELSALVSQRYEEPQGKIEETLAELWRELLGVERVGRNDNFFELGGHSLLLIPMNERLQRAGLLVDIRASFAAASLAELALAVSDKENMDAVPENRIPARRQRSVPNAVGVLEI